MDGRAIAYSTVSSYMLYAVARYMTLKINVIQVYCVWHLSI